MFNIFKRVKRLEKDNARINSKISELEEMYLILEAKSKKTVSQSTLGQSEKELTTSQILDEWLNGKEDNDAD